MTTHSERLAQFSQSEPPAAKPVQLLGEDHAGTYLIPSLCRWEDGNWVTADHGTTITAKVVGWRAAPAYSR